MTPCGGINHEEMDHFMFGLQFFWATRLYMVTGMSSISAIWELLKLCPFGMLPHTSIQVSIHWTAGGKSLQITLKAFHSGFQPLPNSPFQSNTHQSKNLNIGPRNSNSIPHWADVLSAAEMVVSPEGLQISLSDKSLACSTWKSYPFRKFGIFSEVLTNRIRPQNSVQHPLSQGDTLAWKEERGWVMPKILVVDDEKHIRLLSSGNWRKPDTRSSQRRTVTSFSRELKRKNRILPSST